MEAAFPTSSRLLQVDDSSASSTPSQTDDFFVELHRAKLRKQSNSHPKYAKTLKNLAFALTERFEADGRPQDLDEAISLHLKTLQFLPTRSWARSDALRNVVWLHEERFRKFGDAKDLEEAIQLHSKILRLSLVGHSQRFQAIDSLVWALTSKADTYGDPTDRTPSVELSRELLGLCPVGHRGRSRAFNALAWSLHQRYKFQGDDRDLEEAIALLREGIRHSSIKDRTLPYLMCGLACALRTSFVRHGHARDIVEAVRIMRESLRRMEIALSGDLGSEDIMWLGTALAYSFKISGETQVIDEAIGLHRRSLQLCPGRHAYRYTHLLSLGRSLSFRGGVTDFAEAKQLLEEALQLVSGSSPGNIRRQAKVRIRLEELEALVAGEVRNDHIFSGKFSVLTSNDAWCKGSVAVAPGGNNACGLVVEKRQKTRLLGWMASQLSVVEDVGQMRIMFYSMLPLKCR